MKVMSKAALAAGGVVAVALGGLPALTAGAATSPSWTTLRQTALSAASAYRGDGGLTAATAPSSIASSTLATADGTITVDQQSFLATDRSGTVAVNLTLLGGRQLVVTEVSPAAGYQGAALVLQPGTSSVAGAYVLHGSSQADATTASVVRVLGHHHRSGGIVAGPAVSHHGRGAPARLVTVGGCFAAPAAPVVIGSTFGPLVDGEGVIQCSVTEQLAEIVSDYEGSTHVGGTNSGTDVSTWLGVNSYYSCSAIAGTNSFHTAELWSVNGVLQGGATSTSANLHCA